LQIARPCLYLLEQPRVFDGDDGLIGKSPQELDKVVVETARLDPRDGDDTNGLPVAHQWNRQQATPAARSYHLQHGGPCSVLDFRVDKLVYLPRKDRFVP